MPVQDIQAKELKKLLDENKDNIEIIDVREPKEYEVVHLKGAKLIPMNELKDRADEINWDKEVVFICHSGARSKLMADMMAATGKEIKNLKYGIHECHKEGCEEYMEIFKDDIDGYFV